MIFSDNPEEPVGVEYTPKKPKPLDYVIPDSEIDPNAPPFEDEDETYDYFRSKAGLADEEIPPGGEAATPGAAVVEREKHQPPQHISFYYPTSGGTVLLAVGDTQIDFTDGKVVLPNGGNDTLSNRLTGTQFLGIGAIFIVADKSFQINLNGVAKMNVTKNFKKKHINFQRIILSCTVATNFLIWASTDPDADFEKDITEVTIGGGVSPFGGLIGQGSAALDVNTWTTIASRVITKGQTYRLTKAQVQCGSAAWGCVLMGGATVAVWRIPDDGYFVDWYPYGDAVKLLGDGTLSVKIRGRSKATPVTAFGVILGNEE